MPLKGFMRESQYLQVSEIILLLIVAHFYVRIDYLLITLHI